MQEIVVEIRGPVSDAAITREHRYAHGAVGGAIDLRVSRERGVVTVSWNANRGNGWRKPWQATFRGDGALDRAVAFAETKWSTLMAWLVDLAPVQNGAASAAFSAQVASMRQSP